MELIYLALGTNLGDRSANLSAVRSALAPQVQVQRASPVYETEPWGVLDQPRFLNQVLEVETTLEPLDLLRFLKQLEADLGRKPGIRYGPRLIDLDIILFGHRVVSLPELNIPHPRLAERAFVLVPLMDLAPDLRHPVLGKTIRELLLAVDASGVNRYSTKGRE